MPTAPTRLVGNFHLTEGYGTWGSPYSGGDGIVGAPAAQREQRRPGHRDLPLTGDRCAGQYGPYLDISRTIGTITIIVRMCSGTGPVNVTV